MTPFRHIRRLPNLSDPSFAHDKTPIARSVLTLGRLFIGATGQAKCPGCGKPGCDWRCIGQPTIRV